ncbi:DUF7839 domain-containing protein [Methanocaldococcus infernus]|uniref:Transcriptional regulator, MarR family n=1 Tax=Methanocaldococcus infernus (strain DSM 11812 / JCM 15783 / ME) TaxID=573063 RepID=D5VUD5_METIM|nr:winged helix-turn-helix transcriptional regulator [Methanocaldococcus infernus]ADG12747.1 transcriptional regulator, MarR family [Methanocaldococcus infernus ME]
MKKRGITEFQVLSEIIRKQPHIKQKEIAKNLGITIQAVSEHIRNLIKEGYIKTGGRGEYRVTEKGVRRLKEWLSEMNKYLEEVKISIYRYKDVWPAIADEDLKEGDTVYLYMKKGLLHASKEEKGKAKAKVVEDAKKGEDVSVSEIEGIIEINKGEVIIFKIPPKIKGGSKSVNYKIIEEKLEEFKDKDYVVATMGTVGYVVAKKLGLNPDIRFGTLQGIVRATEKGCNVLAFITGGMTERIIKKLDEHKITYTVIDVYRE